MFFRFFFWDFIIAWLFENIALKGFFEIPKY